jgi:hypothetical protein
MWRGAQTNRASGEGATTFRLSVSVDEVSLTFHAADAHGLPVNDLKLRDPERVVSINIRAGYYAPAH